MLEELAVRDLGVIEDLRLVLRPGMTALTGETGAGKTLVVDAIELLVGGRSDPSLVRAGAGEAWVEGRFRLDRDLASATEEDDEVVLARAIPATGRSRAYVNGRLATVAELRSWGERLVDLHGQHAHQSLLTPAVQRAALDRYGGVDLEPLLAARTARRTIEAQLAALGGDERARARELDLVRYQVDELAGAVITGADEDDQLDAEESMLSDAVAHQEAAALAVAALADDGGAGDGLGRAVAAVAGRPPFADHEQRLRAAAAEVADLAVELRTTGEGIADDPQRLTAIRERRQVLRDLRRKYGSTLAEVLAFQADAEARLHELEQHDRRATELEEARQRAQAAEAEAAESVAAGRRRSAGPLADAVAEHLHVLAMPRARVEVVVEGDGPADEVTLRLAANPGSPPQPLAKVASGGELARAMLALRLVLTAGPPTLVFDEVDAGIGGEAAVAVGRALASLAATHQVLVVTHLPQVAAFGGAHVRVTKRSDEDATVATIEDLDEAGRVDELSRMLSGRPESTTARQHASELLALATSERGGA